MNRNSTIQKILAGLAFAALACSGAPVYAQSASPVVVKVTAAAKAAARSATVVHRRALGVSGEVQTARSGETLSPAQAAAASRTSGDGGDGQVRYPGDLFGFGGATVQTTQHHSIYLKPNGSCPIAQCWGNPEGFLRDLGRSEFIHVVDQYVGLTANRRYGVGQAYAATFTPPVDFSTTPFTDNDMLAFVYAAAQASGQTGYGHIYHVFLPAGTDECFDSTFTICYSPDNDGAWYFCAYHSSVDFLDIGHVLYSVEPYQNLPGCRVRAGTPNGSLIDSTNNVLSHEVFETITDPDGDGWWNYLDDGRYGQEIGDECSFIRHHPGAFDPSIFEAHDRLYAAQPEYNNQQHACTTAP